MRQNGSRCKYHAIAVRASSLAFPADNRGCLNKCVNGNNLHKRRCYIMHEKEKELVGLLSKQ